MSSKAWTHNYNKKLVSAREALSLIRNGQTRFCRFGLSLARTPSLLTAKNLRRLAFRGVLGQDDAFPVHSGA